jgi:hypothetical protein
VHDFRDIFIEKSLKEVRAFFKDYNFHELSAAEFPAADLAFAWEGTIICEGERTAIIVGFPLGFPDELPKIYLTNDFKHSNIPHIDDKNYLCTFDTDSIDFFTENVSGMIEAVIDKARDIICEGISGKNQRDFEAEFLAYWSLGCGPLKIYSIFIPEEKKSEILLGQIFGSEKCISWIAGKDEKQIRSYVRRLDNNARIINYEKCLYLPLPIIPVPPFPKNNIEVFNLLNKFDSSYEKAVLTFLKDNEYKKIVIFSVVIGKSRALAAWRHQKPRDIFKHGFRPGRIDDKTLKDRLSGSSSI